MKIRCATRHLSAAFLINQGNTLKVNFLNDDSHKFNTVSSEEDFFGEDTDANIVPDDIFDDFDSPVAEPTATSEIPDVLDDDFTDFETTSAPEEKEPLADDDDRLLKDPKVHQRKRLIFLSVIVVTVGLYFGLDYIQLDALFSSKDDEKPTEYIENITLDKTPKNPIDSEETRSEKPAEVKKKPQKTSDKTERTSAKNTYTENSNRESQLKAVDAVLGLNFRRTSLQQVYISKNTMYFEVFASSRGDIAKFRSGISNTSSKITLAESTGFPGKGVSTLYKTTIESGNASTFETFQSISDVRTIISEIASASKVSVLELTSEKGDREKTPLYIRARGSLSRLKSFINASNESLNNVSVAKFSLAKTSQKTTGASTYLLTMRLNVMEK